MKLTEQDIKDRVARLGNGWALDGSAITAGVVNGLHRWSGSEDHTIRVWTALVNASVHDLTSDPDPIEQADQERGNDECENFLHEARSPW